MDNMTTNSENKSGISIGLDQLLLEDNKSVQLELNYGQNECNSQRVLKENNTKRGKGLFGKKGRGNNPFWKKTAKLYCVLSAVCAIVVMVTLYVTHGDFLSYFLYHDTLDAGMDFFHSIEYVRGRQPYAVFDTLYPPLANLFFYALFLLVPASVSDNWTYDFEASVAMRGTETDLRTTQSCFLLYVFFVVLAVLLLAVLLRDVMQNAQWARASTFFALFSFGVLNAVDRGNIILLAAGLSLFFVMYHRSKRAWVRELALVALAVAAGLKIYPAFLGVMLLRNRDFKAAIRTVFYGIAALVLPVFAFQEGRQWHQQHVRTWGASGRPDCRNQQCNGIFFCSSLCCGGGTGCVCSALPPGMAGVAADYRGYDVPKPGQLYLLHGADSAGVFSCTGKGDDTSKYIAFCGFDGI